MRAIDRKKLRGAIQGQAIAFCTLLILLAGSSSSAGAAKKPDCGRAWAWVPKASGDRSKMIRLKVKCRFRGDSLSDLTVTRLTPAGRSVGKKARVVSLGAPQVIGPGKRRLDLSCGVTTHGYMLRPRSFNGVACSIRGYKPVTLLLRIRVPKMTACKYKVQVRSRNMTFTDDGMSPVGPRAGAAGVTRGSSGSSRASRRDRVAFSRPRNCGR